MKSPKWLVCPECQTARAGRTGNRVDIPEGWRVIQPGEIHTPDHEVYTNLAEYRRVFGIRSGSFDPTDSNR